MLISKLLGERLKEKPSDASIISHIFLIRGGYIRQVSNGIYSMLPPAKRIAMKIEKIIREEMDSIDGQEVLFPVVLPSELWHETGRYDSVGSELLRFKDRTGHDMVLGMTHEEAAVHLARSEVSSYSKFPFMIYQIQTKFRDEPRSRGGLIRVREFTMKDAYSFHTSQEDLETYYEKAFKAYERIFARAGIPEVVSVTSDSGMMGGAISHEFMLLTEAGEDSIVICEKCGYRANLEAAVSKIIPQVKELAEIVEVNTPDVKDIESLVEFFGQNESDFIKAAIFDIEGSEKPLVVFIRGDLQVNEVKVKNLIGKNIYPLTKYEGDALKLGFVGPYELDKNKLEVLYDKSLAGENSLICGANKLDYHLEGISVSRDLKIEKFVDVAKVTEGNCCSHCNDKLTIKRGIEVGNIFQLGTKYTKTMNMTYTDANGKSQYPIMGCYGIGVGRLLASIIETHHDDYGPIWPKSVAPWQIHICMLNGNKPEVRETADKLYENLSHKYEVIFDDRDLNAGAQFADADLLGIPVRIIVSNKNVKNEEVEIATRDKKVRTRVKVTEVEQELLKLI